MAQNHAKDTVFDIGMVTADTTHACLKHIASFTCILRTHGSHLPDGLVVWPQFEHRVFYSGDADISF